jgi:AraC-like DNA-binding protein
MGVGFESELVVASSNVLHEGVVADHDARGSVGLQSDHRPQSGLEPAVVTFDPVVGVEAGVVERVRDQLRDHPRAGHAVGHDLNGRIVSAERRGEEPVRCPDVAAWRHIHVDDLAVLVHCPATPRTDITNDEIRRLYIDRRWTAAEIASHLDCETSTVYARLHRLSVARRPARPRHDIRPDTNDLRELYVANRLSLRQVAERFDVSAQAVHNWMTAAGIERRPPGTTAPAVAVDELAEHYLSGQSGPELAQHFGCSPTTIYRRLADAGIDRRAPTPAIDRATLVAALAEGRTAPDVAAQLDVSITAVCRALQREHLQTSTQAARQRSADHLAALARSPNPAGADR